MDGKAIRNKLVGSDDERAVSPVIGVILMVAITVILAAVIATLVMDFGDSVDQDVNAGVTIEQRSDGTVVATWQSEGTADDIYFRGASCMSGEQLNAVGDTATNSTNCSGGDTITAVANSGTQNTTVATHTYED